MRHVVVFTIVVGVFAGRVAVSADEPSDEQRIRGCWVLVSSTKGSVETKAAEAADKSDNLPLTVTFEDSTWTAKLGPKGAPIQLGGSYFLDSTQTPKLLDVTLRGDGNKSSDLFLIYKFEKDRLYMRTREGGQRPVDFESVADDCTTLVFRKDKS